MLAHNSATRVPKQRQVSSTDELGEELKSSGDNLSSNNRLLNEGKSRPTNLVREGTQKLLKAGTAKITRGLQKTFNLSGADEGTVDEASQCHRQCYVGEISTEIHMGPDELSKELFAFSEPFARRREGKKEYGGDGFLGTL